MTDRRSSTMSSVSMRSSDADRTVGPSSSYSTSSKSVAPLSMKLMRPFWSVSGSCVRCVDGDDCETDDGHLVDGGDFFAGNNNVARRSSSTVSASRRRGSARDDGGDVDGEGGGRGGGGGGGAGGAGAEGQRGGGASRHSSIETILVEYTEACRIYGIPHRINPGVLTALRYSLPTLRVSGNFFDADMLALSEILLKYCNTSLRHVRRLDFTIAGREGGDWGGGGGHPSHPPGVRYGGSGRKGMRSHGAYALSRVLMDSVYIEEVFLVGHRIGPYGAIAIFDAVGSNPNVRTLLLRGCRIGERGAMAFVERVLRVADDGRGDAGGSDGSGSGGGGRRSGLRNVDLSACRIGFRGTFAIEERLREIDAGDAGEKMIVDLEGNMVFQEVMNCVTHGLGIVLGTVGQFLLNKQILGQPSHYTFSCAIYSASVITLYTSSTLYHSFFALRKTKFIFKVFDRCAIYLLIAGSYTPFLMIGLHHKPRLSAKLLLFIWGCAISGILVEAFFLTWEHKSKFSLAMYLGMGWTCVSCLPDLLEILPMNAVGLLVAGGVAYTGGV
jgi:hemolysin III